MALVLLVASVAAYPAAMTDTLENSVIDWLLRGQAFTPPATVWVALFTTCPTDSTAGTEVTGGSYARVSIASSLANWAGTQSSGSTVASSGTGGTTSNNATVPFPPATADWGTVNCFGLMSASSGGTLYIYTALTTPRTITNGSTASFAAAALTFQIDN
ncbi:phage tail fiber protein [Candidatus Contendibacter odensensis]|nr:hypothetical protein [Candidatus Contendobacter odensis]